jgi:hypothetical protein
MTLLHHLRGVTKLDWLNLIFFTEMRAAMQEQHWHAQVHTDHCHLIFLTLKTTAWVEVSPLAAVAEAESTVWVKAYVPAGIWKHFKLWWWHQRNNHGRGSGDVVGIAPQFSTLMLQNTSSNSSTLSFDFTQPEITNACDATLMEIMTRGNTEQVAELGVKNEGLCMPYIHTIANFVNLMTRSG